MNEPQQTEQGLLSLTREQVQALKPGDKVCVIIGEGDMLQVIKTEVVRMLTPNSHVVQIVEWIKKGTAVPDNEENQVGAEFSAIYREFFHLPKEN